MAIRAAQVFLIKRICRYITGYLGHIAVHAYRRSQDLDV